MTTIPRPGDRVRLVSMSDDPDPIHVGQVGTVVGVGCHGGGKSAWFQIEVSWDNGRTLMLVVPPDVFEIVERARGDAP